MGHQWGYGLGWMDRNLLDRRKAKSVVAKGVRKGNTNMAKKKGGRK